MNAHVFVSSFVAIVLSNVMHVVAPDYDRAHHLHLLYDTSEDSPADAHVAGERALLVDVRAFDSLNERSRLVQYRKILNMLNERLMKIIYTSRGGLNPSPTLRI